MRIWLQTERQRHPRIPEVPTVFELMDQFKVPDAKRRLVNAYLGLWGFGSMPIVTSPGTPPDRVKTLRDAYARIFADPEFIEETTKKNWEPRPVSGEELEGLAKEVLNQPPDVSSALKRILSK